MYIKLKKVKVNAPGEARTRDLQIMRLTRCQLRYGGIDTRLLFNYPFKPDVFNDTSWESKLRKIKLSKHCQQLRSIYLFLFLCNILFLMTQNLFMIWKNKNSCLFCILDFLLSNKFLI